MIRENVDVEPKVLIGLDFLESVVLERGKQAILYEEELVFLKGLKFWICYKKYDEN